jgi:hypothetical protein
MSFGRIHQTPIIAFRSSYRLSLHGASLAPGGEQGTPLEPRPSTSLLDMEYASEPRARTTSLTHPPTSLSTTSSHGTPVLRPRRSMASVQSRGYVLARLQLPNALPNTSLSSSDTGASDVVSPLPRRHHLLQQHASNWQETPSPGSTRPNSPSSIHSRSKGASAFASLYSDEHRSSIRHSVQRSNLARRWVRWMDKNGMKHWIIPCSVLVALGVKWATGLGPYSGMWESIKRKPYKTHRDQVKVHHRCTVIMKPKGTGSRSHFTSRHLCGTDTISNTGAWTTHH